MIIDANKLSIDYKSTSQSDGTGIPVQVAKDGSVSGEGIRYTKDSAVQKDMGKSTVYNENAEAAGDKDRLFEMEMKGVKFNPADFIRESIDGEIAGEIEANGKKIEDYEPGELEGEIERIKAERADREEALERQVERQREVSEHFSEMEERIEAASRMAFSVKGLTESAIQYFLDNDLPLNPTAIQSSVAVSNANSMPRYGNDFSDVMNSISDKYSDMDMEAAKWLYENNVPVTEETAEKYIALGELKDLPEEVIRDRIEDEVIDGVLPEQADLTHISRGEAAEIIAQRKLQETRLAMTVESVRNMENKGIHVDITNIEAVVEELRNMEQQAAAKAFDVVGVENTEENVEIYIGTMNARGLVKNQPAAVLGMTYNIPEIGLMEVIEQGEKVSSVADFDIYEKVGTEVRPDLGDSIKKAFGSVDGLLEEIDMEPTAANQRAARILGYNRLEITSENVQQMKEYDQMVSTVVDRLKPNMVAELIKRQINPLEYSLERLLGAINEIEAEVAPEDVSFPKYLWKLDHPGDISPEERKSMIGIYRLLDKVDKSDGAVIGKVINDGRVLSFSSLLSAIRSDKAKGIDAEIDDDFGEIVAGKTATEKIDVQISAAFAGRVVRDLKEDLSPAVLKKRESVMDDNLEDVLEDCKFNPEAIAEEEAYYSAKATEVRQMATAVEDEILANLEEVGIEKTLSNIEIMKDYLKNGSGKTIKKLLEGEENPDILDKLDSPEELNMAMDEFENTMLGRIAREQETMEEPTYESVRDLALMASTVSFYRQMRSYQRYEIPIVNNQGIASMSITFQGKSADKKGVAEIDYRVDEGINLKATLKVSENRVSGFVTGDRIEESWKNEVLAEFKKDLEMNGFTMERVDFAIGQRRSFLSGDLYDGNASNKALYQVAKCFVNSMISGGTFFL